MEEAGKKWKISGKRVTMEDVARHCNVSAATVSRVLGGRSDELSVSEAMIKRVKTAAEQLGYSPERKRSSKRITMEDVAHHCNVSTATVSRVLSGSFNGFPVSEAMVQRVKEAAEQLDYRPNRMARAVRNQRTHLIGLSCFYTDAPNRSLDQIDRDHLMMGRYTDIILSHPEFEDYDLVFHARKESTARPLKRSDFKPDLLDGMIYFHPTDDHNEVLNVASRDFPIVMIGQLAGAEEKMPCIDINNRKMAHQAVEHLIELGRRNILMLIPEKLQHLNCIQDRQQGYCDAIAENGIRISDELIRTVRSLKDHVSAFFEDLPCLEEVDAIFCSDDDIAAFCIAPLKAMGRCIPEDIALIGFGNDSICQHISPALSSVGYPVEKQIYTAIDLLLKILNKKIPYEPGFHEIETELVIRESTDGSKRRL